MVKKQSFRSMQQNRSPEINPYTSSQLILVEKWEWEYIQWRKDSTFRKWCLENRTATSELDIHVVITRVTNKIIEIDT